MYLYVQLCMPKHFHGWAQMHTAAAWMLELCLWVVHLLQIFSQSPPSHPPCCWCRDISMRLRSFLIWSKCRSETSWHDETTMWLVLLLISQSVDTKEQEYLDGKKLLCHSWWKFLFPITSYFKIMIFWNLLFSFLHFPPSVSPWTFVGLSA